jgi:organic radical activating enzyme
MIYGPDTPLYLRINLTLKSKFPLPYSPVGASPERIDTMASDDAKKYIDGVTKAQQATWIEITGGEPFLYYDEMIEVFEHTKAKGFSGKVVTSAFWATDALKSNWIIQRLKDAGVNRMEIRFDAMYSAHVPIDRVKNAAAAARQKGFVVQVISYYLYPSGDAYAEKGPYAGETTNETDRKTMELQNSLLESMPKRCIEWERIKISSAGSELSKLLGDRFAEAAAASEKSFLACPNQNGKISTAVIVDLMPNGETIINGRKIGNARQKELDILLRDFLIESRLAF